MPIVTPIGRAEAGPGLNSLFDRIFGEGRDPVADPGTATGTPGDWYTVWGKAQGVMRFFHDYSYNDAPLALPASSHRCGARQPGLARGV